MIQASHGESSGNACLSTREDIVFSCFWLCVCVFIVSGWGQFITLLLSENRNSLTLERRARTKHQTPKHYAHIFAVRFSSSGLLNLEADIFVEELPAVLSLSSLYTHIFLCFFKRLVNSWQIFLVA